MSLMIFSAHGKVFEKLEFLASGIFSKEDAESALVMLEPSKTLNEAYLTLYTQNGVSCKIYPFNKQDSDVISRTVCVKLADLSNIVSQCRTGDFVTFKIDETTDRLMVSSFHNDDSDLDELEISMKIYESFTKSPTSVTGTNPVISLDYINYVSMMKGFTLDSGAGNVTLSIINKKLTATVKSPKLFVDVLLKQMQKEVFDFDDISVTIPLTSLHMIGSCGHIGNITLTLTESGVFFSNDDYTFFVKSIQSDVTTFDENEFSDYGVVSSESLLTSVSLLNRLNIANESPYMYFEKVDATSVDVTIETESMHTSIYLFMAVLADVKIKFDRFLIERLVTDIKTDALRIKVNGDKIFIKFEDYTTITTLII